MSRYLPDDVTDEMLSRAVRDTTAEEQQREADERDARILELFGEIEEDFETLLRLLQHDAAQYEVAGSIHARVDRAHWALYWTAQRFERWVKGDK